MADLITLEDYKLAKGLLDSKNDTRLESLISSVSQLIKTYCGQTFVDYYSADKTELFNVDWDTSVIQLGESPIVSITSVEERASYGVAYAVLTEAAFEWYLEDASDSLFRTNGTGYTNWSKGPGAVRVLYKSGYAAIPDDLKLAVIDLVTYYFKEEYKERRSLANVSISNVSTSTQWRNVGFPDHIKRILDLYRQVSV